MFLLVLKIPSKNCTYEATKLHLKEGHVALMPCFFSAHCDEPHCKTRLKVKTPAED